MTITVNPEWNGIINEIYVKLSAKMPENSIVDVKDIYVNDIKANDIGANDITANDTLTVVMKV